MVNGTQKYMHKHTFPAFTSSGNRFMHMAGIESPSLYTLYKCPRCHANAVNLKTNPAKPDKWCEVPSSLFQWVIKP